MMLRKGQIRLTLSERRQILAITGSDPGRVNSVERFETFIRRYTDGPPPDVPGSCLARRLLLAFLDDAGGPPSREESDGGRRGAAVDRLWHRDMEAAEDR